VVAHFITAFLESYR